MDKRQAIDLTATHIAPRHEEFRERLHAMVVEWYREATEGGLMPAEAYAVVLWSLKNGAEVLAAYVNAEFVRRQNLQ